jgi:AcrR family transcriptional regulator
MIGLQEEAAPDMNRDDADTSAGTHLLRPEGATARGSLDRRLILSEAVRFIDDRGLDELTMRRLGRELGVEAMALYRYLPSREDLLGGVVDVVLEEYGDPDTLEAVSWQLFLQRVAHAVRAVAVAHPQIFPLVATRPPEAPWLRPPLRSLDWVEAFLTRVRSYGFDDVATVALYRAFSTFLLGHLLLEVSAAGGDLSVVLEAAPTAQRVPLDKYPTVDRLSSRLAENAFDEEFEESLENLLDRLGRLLHRDT